MPTSPLDPSHTTQFKSTIRKPQQSSAPSGSSSTSWPSNDFLSQASFDPASWTYLAEGGKSLLLRFDGDPEQAKNGWLNHNGTRALALRVSKVPRGGAGSSTAATASSSSQGVDRGAFEDQVVAPLLGRKSLLPSSISLKLPSDGVFLEKVSGKIEMSRPKKRRAVDGIDVKAGAVEAIEDLTWCPPGEELLAVEIKPKWLFSSDAGQPYSRYRKHQVLKSESSLTLDEFNALYEPLDLVSGDQDRVERATSGLVRDWKRGGNNLRLYANGQEVTADDSSVLGKLLQRLNTGHQSSKSLESDLSSTLALALCQPQIQSILQRVTTLQADLAAVDIQTLSAWWSAQTRGAPFGAATSDGPEVAQEPTLNEWSEFSQDWLSQRGEAGQAGEGAAMTLRQAVLGSLLSATFKDCSLFLRLSPSESTSSGAAVGVAQDQTATAVTQGDKTTANEAPYADEAVLKQINASKGDRTDAKSKAAEDAAVPFGYTIRLIDLDVKPIEKLPYYLKLEDDIEKTFSQWKEKVGLS